MTKKVKVWEGVIRINHWALALAILALFITADQKIFSVHIILGKVVLMLVIFRILWGFVGSKQARIIPGICALFRIPRYIPTLFNRKPEYTDGHTPLGWAMTFALLLALGFQSLLGMSMQKTYEGVTYAHELSPLFQNADLKGFFNFLHTQVMPVVIITLVSVHVLAVFWYLLGKKQNLLPAMITGKKLVNNSISTNFGKLILPAIVTIIIAAAITWAIIISPQLLGIVPLTAF